MPKGQETVNRGVENFPFRVVRDTLDGTRCMNWSGLKPGVDWVQEAFCLSGGRVSEDDRASRHLRVLCFFLCRTGSFECII